MKNSFSLLLIILAVACSNQAGNTTGPGSDSNGIAGKPQEVVASADDCGNSLLFRKGAEISTNSYDGQGKLTSKQVSTVSKVYREGGMTLSELVMKNTDGNAANEKTFTATYKCDGKLLYVDLSGVLSDAGKTKLETTGLQFPFAAAVGDTLPDVNYSMNMSAGGKTTKLVSHIKERKVEAKESVTTPAGTFDCYKISSVIEAEMEMAGMDEESRKIMDAVKKKMGKNIMTFWYAPAVTIIKMEYRTGDKLVMRSEVTNIKK
ncbi:MAG: hypothetical protein WCF67_18495 [Chitinophagaceae bacterium]